ncbi:hypothetical protein MTP99_017948 [Tenebrio molitor]|nr:hypothetical protein MTP99_017948 [Tenebrio molitor]
MRQLDPEQLPVQITVVPIFANSCHVLVALRGAEACPIVSSVLDSPPDSSPYLKCQCEHVSPSRCSVTRLAFQTHFPNLSASFAGN